MAMQWWSSSPLLYKHAPESIYDITLVNTINKLGCSLKDKRRVQKWVCHVNIACPSKHRKCKNVTRNALPDVTTTVMMVVAVGVAATILANQTKSSELKQKICEACSGSGICGECNGEGFILKRLSKEATNKARKNAKDAATRYTAGLPKKWNYCSKCSGSRSCLACDGRGMIQ